MPTGLISLNRPIYLLPLAIWSSSISSMSVKSSSSSESASEIFGIFSGISFDGLYPYGTQFFVNHLHRTSSHNLQYFYTCHPTFFDKKVRRPLVAIWLAKTWSRKYDKFPASFTDQDFYQTCYTDEKRLINSSNHGLVKWDVRWLSTIKEKSNNVISL